MSYSQFNEAQTRYNLIDPMLVKSGWNLADRTSVAFEVPVEGYDASPQSGITDYCLFRSNGEVLAVIEAKRTKRDPRVGKEQVLKYVEEIGKYKIGLYFGSKLRLVPKYRMKWTIKPILSDPIEIII